MSKTLLLIDAYAMIFRAYYAFIRAPRMNSKGENTSAIFGFCVTLEDLLKKINPTHVGVAFDPAGGTFRHEAYEQYKAQRPETPEDIRKAVPVIKELLAAMNIPVLEVPGFEADDVIGTLSKQGEEAGFEVYMATPDKDYGQLVSNHVFMYRPRHTGGFELMGPAEVCAKYGLQRKEQVIDCKADTSLLRAMEAAGINAPSDCRSGRCGWCHSQLISGDVYIPASVDGRRLADKEFGYIHPCCSFPLSDVTIDVPVMPK